MAKVKKTKKGKKVSIRDRVKKKAQERENTGGISWLSIPSKAEFFNPKKGPNKFDILPYEVSVKNHPEAEKGELWYKRTVWVHFGVGAEEKTYICPLKTIGKPCPICEQMSKLRKDPDVDEDAYKELKPKERELYNVIDDGEIKLFTFSYHLFGKQLEEEIREGDDEYAGFADLEDGYTLKVRFAENNIGTNKFLEASRIDFKTRKKDFPESILDEVFDLDKILKILSYNELDKIFNDDDDDDDEKEERTSKKKKKSTKKKEKTKSEDDEDDDDDDDSGDEDDEDDDDDDDDSGDEDDEDDDDDDDDDEDEDSDDDDDDDDDDEDEDSDDDDDDDEDDEDECPHGHQFGIDCNETDDCDDCDDWEECLDKAEELTKTKKKKKGKRKKK